MLAALSAFKSHTLAWYAPSAQDRKASDLMWVQTHDLLGSDNCGFTTNVVVPHVLHSNQQFHGLVWIAKGPPLGLAEFSVRLRRPLDANTWESLCLALRLGGSKGGVSDGIGAVKALIRNFSPGLRSQPIF